MEMGEEPRHQTAAANEKKQVAVSATRISLFAVILAIVIALAIFGWLFLR